MAASVCPFAQLQTGDHYKLHGGKSGSDANPPLQDSSGDVSKTHTWKTDAQQTDDMNTVDGICSSNKSMDLELHLQAKNDLKAEIIEEIPNKLPTNGIGEDLGIQEINKFGSWEYQKNMLITYGFASDVDLDHVRACAEKCELNENCNGFWLYNEDAGSNYGRCALKGEITAGSFNNPDNYQDADNGSFYKFDRSQIVTESTEPTEIKSFVDNGTKLKESETARYCLRARNYINDQNVPFSCKDKCCGGDCNVWPQDHDTGFDVNALCYTHGDRPGGETNFPATGDCSPFTTSCNDGTPTEDCDSYHLTHTAQRYNFDDSTNSRRHNLKFCDNYVGWRNAGEIDPGGCTHAAATGDGAAQQESLIDYFFR
jgi:hypothetical protein